MDMLGLSYGALDCLRRQNIVRTQRRAWALRVKKRPGWENRTRSIPQVLEEGRRYGSSTAPERLGLDMQKGTEVALSFVMTDARRQVDLSLWVFEDHRWR